MQTSLVYVSPLGSNSHIHGEPNLNVNVCNVGEADVIPTTNGGMSG